MSRLLDTVARFRGELVALDARSTTRLASAYADTIGALTVGLDALAADLAGQEGAAMTDARGRFTAAGELLFRQRRYRALLQQAEAEFDRFAAVTGQVLGEAQRAAIRQAQADAPELIQAALGPKPAGVSGSFLRLPTEPLANLAGALEPGSPLAGLLGAFGPEAAATVRRELLTGLAIGRHPREIAARIADALGGNLARASLIAHTETFRAYRQATLDTFRANDHLVTGWVWVCHPSARTCAACWAMHGSFHPLDEPFGSHPRCRCSPVPATRSWAALGFRGVRDTRPAIRPGAELFARLPAEQQAAILGPSAYAAYRAGEIALADLVAVRHSDDWGTTRSVGSLADARARAVRRDRLAAD